MQRVLAILSFAVLSAVADDSAFAQERAGCERSDLRCWQQLQGTECAQPASTLQTCLVFLQRIETARRGPYSTGLALLHGETLQNVARREVSPRAKERYLQRSRAAYRQVVKNEPFNASGYLGLADVAENGEQRVEWLRGAVRAEFKPAHMELLADALSTEIGGHTADLEAARFIEDAYTYESTNGEKWRYAASALTRYTEALERYPSAADDRSAANVLLRVKDDIDYPQLQRMLLAPADYLPYLADAFATLCQESIVAIISLDECMAGLELAVATAEDSALAGDRRLLAEATLRGMRTIAGEELPRSAQVRERFVDWIDRLLATSLEPVDVAANLWEAQSDFTPDLLERIDALHAGIELSPNRGDLHLKLGSTYVDLKSWPEALEELRAAKLLLLPDEHERVDGLTEKAEAAWQARFQPPDVPE